MKEKLEQLKALNARLEELVKAQKDGWTDDERTEFQEKTAEADTLESEIAAIKEQQAEDAKLARQQAERNKRLNTSAPKTRQGGSHEGHHVVGDVRQNFLDDPMRGFDSHADFLQQVQDTWSRGEFTSDNLRSLAAGSDEHGAYSDPRGGFLVPKGMLNTVKTTPVDMDPTKSMVTTIPMEQDSLEIPYRVDKNHSSSVSGGFNVYWTSETQAPASSTTKFGMMDFKTNELMGLSYATRKLMDRSMVSFAALIRSGFTDEFESKIIEAKMSGTGVGQPLGILNSPALITIAKESGQAADTILGLNLVKMRARCWMYGRAVWLYNSDCYTELSAAHRAMTNSDIPLFIPGNGVDVPDTILGRPAYPTDHCQTVGNLGDIVLGVWPEYYVGEYGDMKEESSIHVRFENSETTFKFYKELAGMPSWETVLTPKNSSVTKSPFVVLAERA